MAGKHGFVASFKDYARQSYYIYVDNCGDPDIIVLLKTHKGDWAWRFGWDDDRARNWLYEARDFKEAKDMATETAEHELWLQREAERDEFTEWEHILEEY